MALELMQPIDLIEVMESYISKNRPSEHIRHKLDLGYKNEDPFGVCIV